LEWILAQKDEEEDENDEEKDDDEDGRFGIDHSRRSSPAWLSR